MLIQNRKAYVAACIVNTTIVQREGILNVAGSHVECKSVKSSESVQR